MKRQIKHLAFVCAVVIGFAGCATANHSPTAENSARQPGIRATDLFIISAVYGSGSKFKEVTDRVNVLLGERDSEFYARPEWLKTDPAPGWNKQLIIIYTFKGRRHLFTTGEGEKVSLSILEDDAKKSGSPF